MNYEWRVVITGVRGVGDIGSVVAETEDEARCAALSKFGVESDRNIYRTGNTGQHIYEDDEFYVRKT